MNERVVLSLGIVVFTIVYWLSALSVLGMLIMGDCIDAAECERSKNTTTIVGLLVAAVIYGIVLYSFARRRSR
jgi:hypothetical protein